MRTLGLVRAALAGLLALGTATVARTGDERMAPADLVVTTDWLAQHLQDSNLVLLHVGEKAEYEKEHLPGAQLVGPRDLAAAQSPGGLTLQLPAPGELGAKLEALGIGDTSRIVVYFGKDWVSPTTRVLFTLDYAGLSGRTSLLDGGMPAWRSEGRPLTSEVRTPKPGHLTARTDPDVLAELGWVKSRLGKPGTVLVDARASKFYEGGDPGSMPRAGHIPGARSVPFATLVREDNKFKTDSEIAAIFEQAGVRKDDTVVSYCHIGQQATVVYFAAKLLGYQARVYDGSWDEWSRHDELPVETAPARLPAQR